MPLDGADVDVEAAVAADEAGAADAAGAAAEAAETDGVAEGAAVFVCANALWDANANAAAEATKGSAHFPLARIPNTPLKRPSCRPIIAATSSL